VKTIYLHFANNNDNLSWNEVEASFEISPLERKAVSSRTTKNNPDDHLLMKIEVIISEFFE
jgi:hypothetical protein